MVQFLSINFFFLGFIQFLLGFSKVPVFLCHPVLQIWFAISNTMIILVLMWQKCSTNLASGWNKDGWPTLSSTGRFATLTDYILPQSRTPKYEILYHVEMCILWPACMQALSNKTGTVEFECYVENIFHWIDSHKKRDSQCTFYCRFRY